MSARTLLASLILIPACTASWAWGQDVRYYQDGGVTFREVRQVVQRPVVETKLEQRQQTVYRQQYSTQVVPQTQTVYTPVTEYHWEPRWHNTWNPFGDPYVAYHWVPTTRWDARTQQVQQTVTKVDMVPQTQTVQVPVTTQRMVNEEYISRTAVPGAAPVLGSVPAAAPVGQPQTIGGISKLDNEPSRAGAWRSGTPVYTK